VGIETGRGLRPLPRRTRGGVDQVDVGELEGDRLGAAQAAGVEQFGN
jgi:hypothetical protein